MPNLWQSARLFWAKGLFCSAALPYQKKAFSGLGAVPFLPRMPGQDNTGHRDRPHSPPFQTRKKQVFRLSRCPCCGKCQGWSLQRVCFWRPPFQKAELLFPDPASCQDPADSRVPCAAMLPANQLLRLSKSRKTPFPGPGEFFRPWQKAGRPANRPAYRPGLPCSASRQFRGFRTGQGACFPGGRKVPDP